MELNREQIIKALECCGGDIVECQKCAYVKNGYNRCKERASQDALALINSQEQKIKELTEENERLRAQNKRYAELEEGCYVTGYKNIKADTVRQMSKMLKDYLDDYYHSGEDALLDVPDMIDLIAKEMLEEE